MERRGLGKGLSALIPAREEIRPKENKEGKGDTFYIRVDQVLPNPYQPREDFDAEGTTDLEASIKEKGIIQPILVRRMPTGYELIAGERRLRAARALNIKEIPAIIKDVKNVESLEIALIENIQRQDLNPIEEAHAYKHLMEQFAYTQDNIAQSVGKARVSVANILRLLKLPLEIQQMLRKGLISFAHGKVLLEIEDSSRQLLLARRVLAKKLSVKELEVLVSAHAKIKKSRPQAQGGISAQVKAIEEELQQTLGTRVKISFGKKRGAINIEFYSHNDLERIYKVIKK